MELKNYMELVVQDAIEQELASIDEPWAKNERS